MASVLSIIHYTFIQQSRNHLYMVVILFGLTMIAASLLFGAVAGDQEIEVILDLGLAVTELFGLIMAIFGAVTLILEEIESKTIYLLLTRPLPRSHYLIGRFFGLLLSIFVSMLFMGVFHLILLFVKGWTLSATFFVSFPFMILKISVITALALFFSLFSTSSVSSIVFTVLFWLLGHFGTELSFLANKSKNAISALGTKAFLFLIPDMSVMNYRDVFTLAGPHWTQQFLWGSSYAFLYCLACLFLALALFSRKEF